MEKRRKTRSSPSSSTSHHKKNKKKKKQSFFINAMKKYDLLLLGISVIVSFIFTLFAPIGFLPWIFLLSLLGIILSLIMLLTQIFPPESKKTMYSLIILCASIMIMITSFVTVKPYKSDSVYSQDGQKTNQQTNTTTGTAATDTKDSSHTSEKQDEQKNLVKSDLSNRSNPVPYRQPFTITSSFKDTDADKHFNAKLEITVVDTIRGEKAWEQIKENNQYNEAAPDGYEYILNRVNVKLTDAESEDLKALLSKYHFSYVSSKGTVYDSPALVLKDGLNAELFNNGEKEGTVCGVIAEDDSPLLRYKNKYFFKIN